MNKKILCILMIVTCFWQQAIAQTDTLKKSNVHIGFIYPLSTNGKNASQYSNVFSLHVLSGISGGEEACTISGLVTIVKGDAQGAGIAGLANLISDTARGVQIAGITNIVKGGTTGLQIAGILNITRAMQGAQIAGIANITKKTEAGVQVAGLVNRATDINVQIGGLVNEAHEVQGAQIAGLVNKAKKVHGVQIGVINIADSSDCSIGVVNLIKNGEKGVSISEEESGTTIAAFRSGGKKIYSIIGIGFNSESVKNMYVLEGGIGMHIPIIPHFLINAEAVSISTSDFRHASYMKAGLRVLPVYRISRTFEVFAGPSINAVFPSNEAVKNIPDNLTWKFSNNGTAWGISIGGVVGVQLCFR